MKAILSFEYDPDDPCEVERAKTMMNGQLWKFVVMNFLSWVRSEIKYKEQEQLEPVRQQLLAMIEEYGLEL